MVITIKSVIQICIEGGVNLIKVNLKKILKERKISLAKLSKATGISTNALSSFQNQKTESIYYPTIEAITKELDISVGELIEQIEEYYEVTIEIKGKVLEKESCTAMVHFSGVEHEATYTHEIKFIYNFIPNSFFEQYNRLIIYLSDETNRELPTTIRQIFQHYDLTEHGKGIYYCIGYLLLQELMKLPDFSSLTVTDKVILNTDAISCLQYKVEDNPKEISRNSREAMEYLFREVTNSLYLVTADRSIKLSSHDVPNNIQYAPYIESLSTLDFVSKVEIAENNYERRLFIYNPKTTAW